MVKVSIIVPVYNTEKYLKKCVESLLSQTEKDIEIILINDGSTDKSEKIIKSFEDDRIVYISKKNSGIGSTRNLGITKAKGKYIMFIDSDDYIAPNCVEKMYNKAINDNCDIVISDYYEDCNGIIKEIRFKSFNNTSLNDNPSILNNINLGPCNKIYKKSILKDVKFEESLKYEDAPFVIKAFINAKKIGKLNECLSYYVIHENSQTTIRDKRIFDILDISNIIINLLKPYDNCKASLTNLIVMILTDYTIQQRYINNKELRNTFIDKAFNILDNLDKNWRKCEYLKKFRFDKRIIKSNKTLTKLYCNIYRR